MYILFTVHVVFVGRLVCSVNVLYMELSYTGSLDRSTRASEHVTVQISYACKTTAGFINCFPLINILFLMFIFNHRYSTIYDLTKLWNVYILFSVVFAGKLVSSVNMKLGYTLKCIFSLLCMWSLLVDWFVL